MTISLPTEIDDDRLLFAIIEELTEQERQDFVLRLDEFICDEDWTINLMRELFRRLSEQMKPTEIIKLIRKP
jgi:hypothetical protein